jgi:ribulose-5-phosphate 4-epimerase/fuculose-1-phosphate aldolase
MVFGQAKVLAPGFAQRQALIDDLVIANKILFAQGVVDAFGHVSARTGPGTQRYQERFIHGEIYAARPDVMSVVHCHAASLIPFGITRVALRPVYHNSSFVGEGVPIFEIRETAGDTDMLVRNAELAKALAATLKTKPAALMRGHGAVIVGKSVMEAVARSVYLDVNAKIQAQAMAMGAKVEYLSEGEVTKRGAVDEFTRPWDMWKRQVTQAK